MNILGIGEIVIDTTYTISDSIKEGQKIQSSNKINSIGGPVPSALSLLNNLGCHTTLIASIGNDYHKPYIENNLKKYGINTKLIIDKKTKLNTIIVNKQNGTRTILRDSDTNKKIREVNINLIKKADVIIFDRHETKAFEFVLKHKRKETKIIVDPSTEFSDKIINIIKKSTYPIFPVETLDNFESSDKDKNLNKLYKLIKKTIIITNGQNGSYSFDGNKKEVIKSVKIKAIDTNGAGDIFRGGFAYGILKGWNLKKILTFSNLVAGLQCKKIGNLTAIPTKTEIKKELKLQNLNFII